ncbi:hypothetical protein H4R34_000279 [Dimargaris verticillata]|uniref:HSF-type DNA-binding domain-containing protein n=1 Tax=Dimargaris verticillata TaxID=2761393 RepID=A0A9W8BC27_9FUNG|nr:hypothetical protein H4R34_000279 [Dimargaris verticillata]
MEAESFSFATKLYNSLEDPLYRHCVTWDTTGQYLVFTDIREYERLVLPRYHKTRAFKSLVRQLHLYGFRRGTDARKQRDSRLLNYCSFYHPRFIRGRRDLLPTIKRKPKSAKARAAAQAAQSQSPPLSPPLTVPSDACTSPEPSLLTVGLVGSGMTTASHSVSPELSATSTLGMWPENTVDLPWPQGSQPLMANPAPNTSPAFNALTSMPTGVSPMYPAVPENMWFLLAPQSSAASPVGYTQSMATVAEQPMAPSAISTYTLGYPTTLPYEAAPSFVPNTVSNEPSAANHLMYAVNNGFMYSTSGPSNLC